VVVMTDRDGPRFPPRGRKLVYVAIADVLEDRIKDGTYPPDTALPAEPRLVAEFGAARETVRQAIRLLVSRGLVEVVRGKGTYVKPPGEWPEPGPPGGS
jgi:DNA-binding GntR family transcriptional regulator